MFLVRKLQWWLVVLVQGNLGKQKQFVLFVGVTLLVMCVAPF